MVQILIDLKGVAALCLRFVRTSGVLFFRLQLAGKLLIVNVFLLLHGDVVDDVAHFVQAAVDLGVGHGFGVVHHLIRIDLLRRNIVAHLLGEALRLKLIDWCGPMRRVLSLEQLRPVRHLRRSTG